MRFPQSVLPVLGAVSALFTLGQARSQASEAIRQTTPIDNAVIRTEAHQIDHLSHFDLTFELHGQRIKLELEPNHDILADDAYVNYIGADGLWEGEPIQRHEHKVFRGRALVGSGKGRWNPAGWARITVRKDGPEPLFEGAFSIDHNKHHIELQSTYLAKKRPIDTDIEHRSGDYMIVYRDTDMLQHHGELKKRSLGDSADCSANKLDYNADLTNSIFPFGVEQPDSQWGVMPLNTLFGLSKRQSNDVGGVSGNTAGVNLKSTVGDTSGCPKTRKVALIGVATDCEMTNYFKSNSTPKDAAKDWVINLVNTASSLYEHAFNVSIGLRNLTVNDQSCPTTATSALPWNIGCNGGNITWRLNEFSKWRASNADNNAYWTLMTGCATGQEVGVSWMGRLCSSDLVTSSDGSSVSGANVVVGNQGSSWQIFAHETGHTFGAVHDCDTSACADHLDVSSQCCPLASNTCNANAKYIMNPYADPSMTTFSQCTVGNICSAIGRNSIKSSCLSDNRGVVTISGGKCGNGIVEAGEDCDCGGEESCGSNACCDAKTCKFKNNAVCDDSNESCCNNCQFSPANSVCRASTNACDIAETCSGNSSSCPSDTYKDDGSSCGSGLTCASGQCTSRDYQCRTVMGSLLNTNDTWACANVMAPSCRLVCGTRHQIQTFAPGDCIDTYQNFLDGTPCESGGKCYNGQCKGSSVGGWINDHKNLVIGIAVGVGSLIALTVLYSLIHRCRAARARKRMAKNARPPPGMVSYSGRRLTRGPPRGPPPPSGPPMNQWYGYPDPGHPNNGYPQAPPPRYA